MSIKEELLKLKEPDIWSFMLFALFQVKDVPEYSGLSELAYVLDKKNLLRLCEYFGGLTITVPTIEELESLIYGLLLYQYTEIEHMEYEEAFSLINSSLDARTITCSYLRVKEVLENYNLSTRSKMNE